MDLHRTSNSQITEERRIHEAFNGLVRRRWVAEIAEQHVAVAALERRQQFTALISWEVAQEQAGIALVEDPSKANALLQPLGETPLITALGQLSR